MPSLQIESGKHKGKRIKLPADGAVIGRGEEASLRIASGEISREHCRLVPDGNGFTVTDLGSSNGTFINGTPISVPTPAGPGDKLVVGPITFTVVGVGSAAASSATRKPAKKGTSPRVKKPSKPDGASDADVNRWLAEDVPDATDDAADTHIINRGSLDLKPKEPTRTFDSVAEEAADIIRRHREAQNA